MNRPQWRFTANYRLHQRLQVGIELNPKAQEVGPLVTLFLLTETETRPALFFGHQLRSNWFAGGRAVLLRDCK